MDIKKLYIFTFYNLMLTPVMGIFFLKIKYDEVKSEFIKKNAFVKIS